MAKDAELEIISIAIDEYRAGIKKTAFNDQSANRRNQSSVMLSFIYEVQRELDAGYRPPDFTAAIQALVKECKDSTSYFTTSRLSVYGERLLNRLVAINKLNSIRPARPKRYKKIQFVGFYSDISAIDVSGANKNSPRWAKTKRYAGEDVDIVDITFKIQRFVNAIEKAETSNFINNDADVLKLVMGPEFFLRGASGAYALESIWEILDSLRKVTKENKYKDWLFVPGTAVASVSGNIVGEAEVFNIALIQKGGYAEADNVHDALVYKEYVSHIDFLSKNVRGFGKKDSASYRQAKIGDKIVKLNATTGSRDFGGNSSGKVIKEDGAGVQGSNLAGGSVFTIDGVRFGLEVCLDHAKSRLKSAIEGGGNNIRRIDSVDVQLIPSAGMTIIPECVATKSEGLIFNVDGFRPIAEKAVDLIKAPSGVYPRQNPASTKPAETCKLSQADDQVVIYAPIDLP